MKLQDYAPYYIGCRCFNTWFPEGHEQYDKGWKLMGVCPAYARNGKPYLLENEDDFTWTDSIKLILRNLKDINDEDIKSLIDYDRLVRLYHDVSYKLRRSNCITVYYSVDTEDEGVYPQVYDIHLFNPTPLQFHHLLKAGFDMFSLIKNGLAIDSKTLK